MVQEQGETVIGGKLQPKRLVAGEAAHLRAFVQDEPFQFAAAEGYFIIAAEIGAKARGSQIEIEPREKLRLPGIEIELDLFAQFAAQRFDLVLAGVDAAAEHAPMARVPDTGNVVPQLQEIAAVCRNEDGGDCVA